MVEFGLKLGALFMHGLKAEIASYLFIRWFIHSSNSQHSNNMAMYDS